MLLTAAGLFAVFFFLVQFVQDVLGYSAIKAGFAFLPVSAAVVVSAQIASRMVIRTGAKSLIAIGAIAMAVGMLWFSRITVDTGYLTLLLPAMVVLGIGLGFIFVPITITAVGGVEHEDAGIASAMLNVMQQVGGTLGLSALVTVSATATTNFLHASNPATTPGGPGALLLEAITHGWAVSFLFAAAFAAIALVIDLVTVDSSREAAALPGGAAAG
jgi:predicted MFS family arabinose efflux permease